jgi:hypothetical protein
MSENEPDFEVHNELTISMAKRRRYKQDAKTNGFETV